MERRRFLLLGAAAVGLAGCTFGGPEVPEPSEPGSPADADAEIRAAVAASELSLIASYRSAIEAAPELAGDLEPLLAHHQAHLARTSPGSGPTGQESGPTATGSPGTDAPAGISPIPLLAVLAEAELAALAQRSGACDAAQDPGLARDLCLIAASEAQHAALLTRLTRDLES